MVQICQIKEHLDLLNLVAIDRLDSGDINGRQELL